MTVDPLDPRRGCCQGGTYQTLFWQPGIPNAPTRTVWPCSRSSCPGCTIADCGRPPPGPLVPAPLLQNCRYQPLTRARWAGAEGPLTARRQFLLLASGVDL